jgi:zinc protease
VRRALLLFTAPAARIAFFLSLVLWLAAAPAVAAPDLKPETYTLDNGLEIVVIPDHRAAVATHMVWYRVGAADEPNGKSGIAHFLEHLMFRGTEKVAASEFSKIVARNGGEDNAFTTQDYTAYFQRVAVDRLPLVMELEADRMRNLRLTPKVVATERKVILEERRSRIDNDPASLLYEKLQAVLYLSHPYGIPTIGWQKEMEGLTREDALSFYKTYYAPNNAILVVAGDVTGAQVLALAKRYYGPLAPTEPMPARVRPNIPPQNEARRVVFSDARVELPALSRYYLAPSYATAAPGEAEAIDLMVEILGGGATSRLYRTLVVDKALAASAGAWYSGSALNDTAIGLFARPREGVSLDTLEAALDAVIADLINNGVTGEELKRAKTGMVADATYARDSQQTMARIFGESLSTGETVADVVAWPRRIEAAKKKAVEETARRYLVPERSVTGLLVPATAPPGQSKAGSAVPPVPPPGPPTEPLH